MSQKTWGGRFTGGTDARVEAFTESISFDRRLYRHDIIGSQAHARMLGEVGLLTAGGSRADRRRPRRDRRDRSKPGRWSSPSRSKTSTRTSSGR